MIEDQFAPKHKLSVNGYENKITLLTKHIHDMQYDKVEEFYLYTAAELRKQAEGDRGRGRQQLASLLEEAAVVAEQQQKLFGRIWALCKPYMEK